MTTTAPAADHRHVPAPSAPADRRPDPDPAGRRARSARVTLRGVLGSEWVKLRSVRSNLWALGATCAALLLIGLLSSGITGGLVSSPDPGGDPGAAAAAAPLQGTLLAQLVIAVLGVLAITSEYATGLIRATLTAVPARLPVLWAKAAVVAAVTLPAVLVSLFVTYVAGEALIGTGDVVAPASLGDPGVLRAVVGTGVYLTGIALIGLAVGTLLRGTAAAISTVFGLVFLLPGLGSFLLPAAWRDGVLKFLPSNAGDSFATVVPGPELLGTLAGAGVFLAWVVVPLVAAAVVLRRRNV